MPFITFVKDVRGSDGPLYAAGYQADVTEKTARKWIGSGDAVAGKQEVAPAKPAKRADRLFKPVEPKPEVTTEDGGAE